MGLPSDLCGPRLRIELPARAHFRWLLGCGNECVGGLAGSGCGSRSGVRTVSRTACLARVSDRDTDISNIR